MPGEPRQRNPHPRVTIRSRRNLTRRELTRLEATYLEAVIGYDRWCEIDWGKALNLTLFRLEQRAGNGDDLPRSEAFQAVAANEHPKHRSGLFRSRVADLVGVMAESEQAATQSTGASRRGLHATTPAGQRATNRILGAT